MGGGRRGANYAAAHTGGTLTIIYYDVMEFLLRICFRSRNLSARARAVKRDRNFRERLTARSSGCSACVCRKCVAERISPRRAQMPDECCDETLPPRGEPSAGPVRIFTPCGL